MSKLQTLDKDNFSEFQNQPDRVLILGKSDCAACQAWALELIGAMEDGSFSAPVPIGKLDLDQRGLTDFKRDNPWLKDVTDLPFNLIYKSEKMEKSWAGGGIDRLRNRLQRLNLHS